MKKILIVMIVSFILGFITGLVLKYSNEKVVVKEVVVKKTEYIKVPTTTHEYKECYESPIHIDVVSLNDRTLRVTASDACKKADAIVTVKPEANSKIICTATVSGFLLGALTIIIIGGLL